MWDGEARRPRWAHLLHSETVNCVTASQDGRVAVGTENGVVYVGATEVAEGQTNFQTHYSVCDDAVTSIAFAPDGDVLAVGSADTKIYLVKQVQDENGTPEIHKAELTGNMLPGFSFLHIGTFH